MRVPLASSGLRAKDIELVNEILLSGKLTMGEQVKRFETLMQEYLQVEHFIMTNSGSSANLLIFEALLRPTKRKPFLKTGDRILVPAIAWPTTIWPIVQLGLTPVFVDVEQETVAIDLEKAQELIDETQIKISGIFPIHPLGYSISPRRLGNFVERNNLVLVNDVCESLGSWREGSHAGTTGIAGSFSFYFSHHITTMEGGGVATNDSAFADDLRSMRSHGWSRDRSDAQEWNSLVSSNDAKFLFVSTGFNVRPMEIQAAVGASQILEISSYVNRRREIATRVHKRIASSSLKVLGEDLLADKPNSEWHSWMLIPLYVSGADAHFRRNQIVSFLNEQEIETRPILTGNFLDQPAIQRIMGNVVNPENYVRARDLSMNAFLVGAHHDLTEEQVEYLCEKLSEAAGNFAS